MALGKFSRCHQLADRSLFVNSYQFPVCARCTGVFLGNICAILLAVYYIPHWLWLVTGCFIMFLDWFVQYVGIFESNNSRRLITGIVGGYSLTSFYILVICFLFNMGI